MAKARASMHRAPEQLLDVVVEPFEQQRIPDAAVFDDLGDARPELALRQRRERVGVGDDNPGLVERADEILASGMVDAGLASDRGVDLREQRRRYLRIADAALVAGGREAGDVAHDASTQRQHGGVAVHLFVDQRVDDPPGGLQGLVALSVGQYALGDAPFRQGRCQLGRYSARHGGVGDDQQVPGADMRVE